MIALDSLSPAVVAHLGESEVGDLDLPGFVEGEKDVLAKTSPEAKVSDRPARTTRVETTTDLRLEIPMCHSLPVGVGHGLADLAGDGDRLRFDCQREARSVSFQDESSARSEKREARRTKSSFLLAHDVLEEVSAIDVLGQEKGDGVSDS